MIRRSRWPLAATAASLTALALIAPQAAYAHGFGERYDLPVPLSLYITGAGLTVALSFIAVAVFLRNPQASFEYPRLRLSSLPGFGVMASAPVLNTLRAITLLIVVLVIVTGGLGVQRASTNIAPTLVWIYWWVGLAFASALIGNVWALINPLRTSFEWMDSAARRLVPGGLSFGEEPTAYPEKWGAWPAVVLFCLFAWFEIAYEGSDDPGTLAIVIAGYALVTWWGMALFGAEKWLRNGEVFSILFGFLARFAPIELRAFGPDRQTETVDDAEAFRAAPSTMREVSLRPPGVGLLHSNRASLSIMILVVIFLSTVTFDGFSQTPPWQELLLWSFTTFSEWSLTALMVTNTVGLILFAGLFVGAYLGFSAIMARSGPNQPDRTLTAARLFAFSLIPIAVAYHLAHFFSYLLIQGQLIIPLVSDPFGFGWDLFQTADYSVNIAIVNARIVWIVAIASIVIGHVIAVFLAHITALRHFRAHDAALRSQRAMLILMVGYTMISLWILAQPITTYA